MRWSNTQKEESRRRLLSHASERFRRDGLNAVGIRTLVADAGMTHGAFYAHFPARSDLVAAAVDHAFADTFARLSSVVERAPSGHALQALIDDYLGERHLLDAGTGCTGAALAPEVAREGADAREAFTRGMDDIAGLIAEQLPAGSAGGRDLPLGRTVFAMMMGILQIARMQEGRDAANATLEHGRLQIARLVSGPAGAQI